jgi:hypothetical protein
LAADSVIIDNQNLSVRILWHFYFGFEAGRFPYRMDLDVLAFRRRFDRLVRRLLTERSKERDLLIGNE